MIPAPPFWLKPPELQGPPSFPVAPSADQDAARLQRGEERLRAGPLQGHAPDLVEERAQAPAQRGVRQVPPRLREGRDGEGGQEQGRYNMI